MSSNLTFETSIITDLLNNEDMIFSLQKSPVDSFMIACSTSKDVIKIYNVETNNLMAQFNGHTNTISELVWSPYHPGLLFSCSLDNTVRGWDLRSGSCQIEFVGNEENKFFCLSLNGPILAAGGVNKIFLWDIAKRDTMIYDSSHSEEVTQLKFHPNQINKLFSGSDDGLLCMFDISKNNEKDALEQVYPIEDSISKIGIFGPSNEFLYCQTIFSNFSIWSIEREECILEYKEIRNLLSQISGVTINYLLECQYNPNTNQFFF